MKRKYIMHNLEGCIKYDDFKALTYWFWAMFQYKHLSKYRYSHYKLMTIILVVKYIPLLQHLILKSSIGDAKSQDVKSHDIE